MPTLTQRSSAIILIVLLALLLASCGVQPSATQSSVTPVATTAGGSSSPAATAAPAATVPDTTATDEVPAAATTSVATTPAATTDQDATPAIVAAANAFLDTLSDQEREAVLFDWTDTAQKQRWSNFPEGLFERAGLMWENLNETQRNAWLALMQATLSEEGYQRVIAAWNADDVLATQESGGGGGPGGQLQYGAQYYWVALIGTPSATEPWQWQWGGHHITVNATIVGSNVALTPSFIGCQPCTYTGADGNTVRPLGDIEDAAFALVNALDETQQQAAILGNAPIDLVLGPGQDGRTLQPEGLSAAAMTQEQRAVVLELISHYAGLINDEDAAARMAEIEAGLDETYFAWYGPTTEGSAAYFRVTGPDIVIEYSPQQMGGNAANHIHGIYRDPTNDYGAEYTGIEIGS